MDRPTGEAGSLSGQSMAGVAASVGLGSWAWDLASGLVTLDDKTRELLGLGQDAACGPTSAWLSVIHPDDVGWVVREIEQAIANRGTFEIEYRIRPAEGQARWLHVRARMESDAHGKRIRLSGVAWDNTEAHVSREDAQHALRYMSDGFLALDKNWRITNANFQAETLLGAAGSLNGQVLWNLPEVRKIPGLEARCRKAAAGMKPASFEAELPGTGRWYRFRFVPVPDGLVWYFTDVTRSRQRRAERRAAREVAANRAARIQDLATGLAEAVTSQDVLTAVAERVLAPFGASGLIVEVPEGGRMRVVGAVGYSESFVDRLDGMPLRDMPELTVAMRDHKAIFLSSPQEYSETFPHAANFPSASGKQAWAFMPLVVSGRAMGLCVVSFTQPKRLNRAERALLLAICGLTAQALERARLYDAEHAQAQELQRGLLPLVPPSLPAMTVAATYLPAGTATAIGGDWYDVIPLSADRVALVMGDVMGHGLPEAVIMGRLRTAVQTLSDLDLPPDEILGHLNDVVNGLGPDSPFVTCLYAVYDPTTRICNVARAGHPPPAVVSPDGKVAFAEGVPDPPLGVAEPPFEAVEVPVPDDGLLVLYTDGLVESAAVDIDTGMGRLAELLRRHHDEDLDRLCSVLTQGLLPADQQNSDDAALLIVRTRATPSQSVADWPLPDDATAAQVARRQVREQLAAWELDDMAINTELLASELVANVIRHARGPIRLRLLRDHVLTCEVFDGSLTTPRIRRAAWTDEGGRGLHLVAALSDRWGTRYLAGGKCIWTEQSMPAPQLGDGQGTAGLPQPAAGCYRGSPGRVIGDLAYLAASGPAASRSGS